MKWLVDAIEKRLRDVLIPCDPSDPVVRVDLRAGLIELENVRLSSEYLAKQSTLPVDVRDSLIRSVRVKFSLSSLLTRRRIEVEMDGVAVILTPRVDPPIAVARAVYRAEKQRAITGAELWQAHARSISASLGAPGDAAGGGGGGGMRKLRAFAARVAQQASPRGPLLRPRELMRRPALGSPALGAAPARLFPSCGGVLLQPYARRDTTHPPSTRFPQALLNAIVRISRVHIRYECAVGASSEPVALGVMVRRLVVTEAPRDHPRGHPYWRDHPSGGGNASRALCVEELAIYCEAAAPLESAIGGVAEGPAAGVAPGPAAAPAPGQAPVLRGVTGPAPPLPTAQARAGVAARQHGAASLGLPAAAASPLTPHSRTASGRWDAMRCLDEFGEPAPLSSPRAPSTPVMPPTVRSFSGAGLGRAAEGGEPSWLLCPMSFELRLTSQTSDTLDLTRPATTLTLLPTLRGGTFSEETAHRRLSKTHAEDGGAPLRLRVCISTWQINALEEVDKSLTLYVRRQRSHLNGRPEASPREDPRAWWQYALRCVAASREALRVCTELSGHSWGALWRVLAMRQRYLQLHRRGRYAFPALPVLSPAQAEELLHMEDLLELDTILLFRRFVDWQMVALHGEAATREAYAGGGGDGAAPPGLEGLRVQGEGDDEDEAGGEGGEAPDVQLALSDLQSLTQVAVQLVANGKAKPKQNKDTEGGGKPKHGKDTEGESKPKQAGKAGETEGKPKPHAPSRTAGGQEARPPPAYEDAMGEEESGLGSPTLSEEESLAWPEPVSRAGATESAASLGGSSPWSSSGLFGWGSRATWSWAGGLGGGGSESAGGSAHGLVLGAGYAGTLSADNVLLVPRPAGGASGPWSQTHPASPSASVATPTTPTTPRPPEVAGMLCRCLSPLTVCARPKVDPAAVTPPAAPFLTPPPLRPIRSALSPPTSAPLVSRIPSKVSFKPGDGSLLLSRTTSVNACVADTIGEASAPAAVGAGSVPPLLNPFGAKEAFLLRPRGVPGMRPQPSRERRVRRKRNHLFDQLHDALQQGNEGSTPRALPAWLAHADNRRVVAHRSLLSRAGSFTATLAERALGDSSRRSSIRDLRAAQRGAGSSTGSSAANLFSAERGVLTVTRPRRPARSRADWQLLGVQGLLYDTWRQAHPTEVEALEALTSAAVRDANTTTPPDYTRLKLGFAAPIAAELRLLVAGRQKLFLQTEQLVMHVGLTQDLTRSLRLLLGPVSAFAITLRLCNQTKLTAATDAALSRLRAADADDALRRPPLPHQTTAAALLDEGRGTLFLSYTKPADTRLRKGTPTIRFRLAPDLTADAHLPDGFILNVPNLERMRELGRELAAANPAAAIAAAVAASGSVAAAAAAEAAAAEAEGVVTEMTSFSGGSASFSRRVATAGLPSRRALGTTSEDALTHGSLRRRRLGTLSFPKYQTPRELQLPSPAKPPRHKRSATAEAHPVRQPSSPKFRRSSTFCSDPTKPPSPTLRRSFTTAEIDGGARGAAEPEIDSGSKPASPRTDKSAAPSPSPDESAPARGRRLSSKPWLSVTSSSETSIADSAPPAEPTHAAEGSPAGRTGPAMAPSASHPALSPPPPLSQSASASSLMGMGGDKADSALTAVLRPRPIQVDRSGAVSGPLLLGAIGTLIVPQTAVVVSAMLPDSLAVFCHSPAASRAAPPFVYVPVLSARRMPGLIGYTQIAYDMGVVQTLGAGEKRRNSIGGSSLTGVLRSSDVIAKPLFAKRLLEHFEQRRWLRSISKLDKQRAARDKPTPRVCGCVPAGRMEAAGGLLEWPVLLFISTNAWLYETAERLRASADRCLQRGVATGQEATNERASFVRIPSEAVVAPRSRSTSSFFFWSSSAQTSAAASRDVSRDVSRDMSRDASVDELDVPDDDTHFGPPANATPLRCEHSAPAGAGMERAASSFRVGSERSWEAEQVAGMVELERRSAEAPAGFRLASLQGALEGVAETEGSVISVSDKGPDDAPPDDTPAAHVKPDATRKPRKWHLNPFALAKRSKAKRAA
jgi:hypothetical protein